MGPYTWGATSSPHGGFVPRQLGAVRDDAGQLDLELDGAVLVEVPVEAVLVVADGGDERDDEPARAPHLRASPAPVDVLPQDARVLLVHADGVRERHGAAAAVVDHRVEIADLAQAVAADLERIGERADAVLADVEGIAVEVGRPRIAVRHHHVGDGGAVEDRALAPLVLVASRCGAPGPRAGVKPMRIRHFCQRSSWPAQLEARALRLADLDRLEAGARRPPPSGE